MVLIKVGTHLQHEYAPRPKPVLLKLLGLYVCNCNDSMADIDDNIFVRVLYCNCIESESDHEIWKTIFTCVSTVITVWCEIM